MRNLVLALALAAGLESAAFACSCIAPGSPDESRSFAREAVQGIAAIVEAEALTEYRPGGPGEQVRVHRTLFGTAPATLQIERGPFASSASCDVLLSPGKRKVLILRRSEGGAYTMQSLCSDYLTSEQHLPITIDEARRSSGMPAKAGERAESCPPQPRVSVRAKA